MVQGKDPIKRQQTGQHRADPQNARRDGRQQSGIRAHAKGHQHNDNQIKRQRQPEPAPGAKRQTNVA
jgi:hypothetical protein